MAHWWVELYPGVWLQGPGVPELLLDCQWMGPVPDTGGSGVQGVLKLVLAGWWVVLGPSQS